MAGHDEGDNIVNVDGHSEEHLSKPGEDKHIKHQGRQQLHS
jgi:hypothetical protein